MVHIQKQTFYVADANMYPRKYLRKVFRFNNLRLVYYLHISDGVNTNPEIQQILVER